VPLEIKAISAAEIEAKQREDEAAAAAAAKKRQDEEAAAAAAAKQRQEVVADRERLRRTLLAKQLRQCRKAPTKAKRVRCERRVRRSMAVRAAA
jgi:hypothetical protein